MKREFNNTDIQDMIRHAYDCGIDKGMDKERMRIIVLIDNSPIHWATKQQLKEEVLNG